LGKALNTTRRIAAAEVVTVGVQEALEDEVAVNLSVRAILMEVMAAGIAAKGHSTKTSPSNDSGYGRGGKRAEFTKQRHPLGRGLEGITES
jgi:hypothetical protein